MSSSSSVILNPYKKERRVARPFPCISIIVVTVIKYFLLVTVMLRFLPMRLATHHRHVITTHPSPFTSISFLQFLCTLHGFICVFLSPWFAVYLLILIYRLLIRLSDADKRVNNILWNGLSFSYRSSLLLVRFCSFNCLYYKWFYLYCQQYFYCFYKLFYLYHRQ